MPKRKWKPTHTVVVDTVRPVIDAKFRDLGNDMIELVWSIEDAHPDLRTLRADYRLEDEKEWRKWSITPLRAAKFMAKIDAESKVAEVRLRVKDKAGNEGETILKSETK